MLIRTALVLLGAAGWVSAADDVVERVSSHAEKFGALSRQIWENPELGFHEATSSSLLQKELEANGFDVKSNLAGMSTAFTATFGSGKPVIGIMDEFDALPGLSQNDVPTLSPLKAGGPGHGCGHNLLGAASALAAVAIKEEMQAKGLKGTIRYYGTPAEEGGGGKIYMVHAGLFKDVDAMLSWHPGDSNRVSVDSNLSNISGKFRFYGTASHAAAAPERGRSALDGAMIMLNAVEMLREHVPQDTRIHYVITNGGSAANVVPNFAEVALIARNPDAGTLSGIWDRVQKCAQAGALASETRMEFELESNYANILPNDALAEVMGRALRKAGGYEYTADERKFAEDMKKVLGVTVNRPGPDKVAVSMEEGHGSASSDSGDVSWVVPMGTMSAATFVPGVSAHTWQAAACAGTSIGRKGMLVAARTLALSGVELLEKPAEIDAAKTSFQKRLAGRQWTTRITPDAKPPLNYAVR